VSYPDACAGVPLCFTCTRLCPGAFVAEDGCGHGGQVKTCFDPVTGLEVPYLPHGRFLHVGPVDPVANFESLTTPWWEDASFIIGKLTTQRRFVRIVNTLTSQDDMLEVAREDTVDDIQQRYLRFNAHSGSYLWVLAVVCVFCIMPLCVFVCVFPHATFDCMTLSCVEMNVLFVHVSRARHPQKRLGKPLDMSLTLDANGVPEETDPADRLGAGMVCAPGITPPARVAAMAVFVSLIVYHECRVDLARG
jgi:hypothetical protein